MSGINRYYKSSRSYFSRARNMEPNFNPNGEGNQSNEVPLSKTEEHRNGIFGDHELRILKAYCKHLVWVCANGLNKPVAVLFGPLFTQGDPGASLIENQANFMLNMNGHFIYPHKPKQGDVTDTSFRFGSQPHILGTINGYISNNGQLNLSVTEIAYSLEQQVTMVIAFILSNVDPIRIRLTDEPDNIYGLRVQDMFGGQTMQDASDRMNQYISIMTPVYDVIWKDIFNPDKLKIYHKALIDLMEAGFLALVPFKPDYRIPTSGTVSWNQHTEEVVNAMDAAYNVRRYKTDRFGNGWNPNGQPQAQTGFMQQGMMQQPMQAMPQQPSGGQQGNNPDEAPSFSFLSDT